MLDIDHKELFPTCLSEGAGVHISFASPKEKQENTNMTIKILVTLIIILQAQYPDQHPQQI